jgi:hypothetical protein
MQKQHKANQELLKWAIIMFSFRLQSFWVWHSVIHWTGKTTVSENINWRWRQLISLKCWNSPTRLQCY